MNKLNKKGFTIVELVIVIAVIAILAAVLIPTFSGVVDKANKSAAMQGARNAVTGYIADKAETDTSVDLVVLSKEKYFEVKEGEFKKDPITVTTTGTHNYKVEYKKTTDSEINGSKTYYVQSGSTYSKVESPVVDSIGTYYEKKTTSCACGASGCELTDGDFVKYGDNVYTLVDTYEGCEVYSK